VTICPGCASSTRNLFFYTELALRSLQREEKGHVVVSRHAIPAILTLHHRRQLPGAINIPLKELGRGSIDQLERARPVIVYCYDSQ